MIGIAIPVAVLVASTEAWSQDSLLDLDRDGLLDVATTEVQSEAISVNVWLGSNGGPERPVPDIHVSCAKGCESETGLCVLMAPDIDLDGKLELGLLSTRATCTSGELEQVYTIFMSATGLPGVQYSGSNAEVLAAVFDARARGHNLDVMMWTAFPSGTYDSGGSSGSGGSSSESGSSGSSGSGGSGSGGSCSSGVPCGRLWDERLVMAFALYDGSAVEWVDRLQLYATLSEPALKRAEREFPNDPGRQNALRHALWQFLLTCSFGAETAKVLGDIHEECATDACDSAIDQFNNGRARALVGVVQCPASPASGDDCACLDGLVEELKQRIEAGEFIKDRNNPRVSPPCPKCDP